MSASIPESRVPDDAISTGYGPRKLQAELHRSLRRFNVLVEHRRFGKTVFCINEAIDKAVFCPLPEGRYAYVAPYLNQAKDVAWSYLKRYTAPLPGHEFNESELRVDLANGARIRLYGADNADRLRGLYLDGVILDEYGDMSPHVWSEIVRPMLTDRKGWAIFIGTPKGRNHFADLYDGARLGFKDAGGKRVIDPDWFADRHRASETGIISQAELDAARKTMTDEQYEREFECSFDAPVPGAYYAKLIQIAEKQQRITRVPYDPSFQVMTAWDLGVDDMTSIWFIQHVGRERRIIDFYENSGFGFDHYVGTLNSRGYAYAKHFLPHDVEARDVGTAIKRIDTLRKLGLKNIEVVSRELVEEGISAVRQILPACYFDAQACERGLLALKQYRSAWDEKENQPLPRPKHDWTSHAADAFRYYAMGHPATAEKPKSLKDYPLATGIA